MMPSSPPPPTPSNAPPDPSFSSYHSLTSALPDHHMAQHQLLRHPYPVHHHRQEVMLGGSNSDSQSLDSIIASSKAAAAEQLPQAAQDKKQRPPDSEAQKCPRCDSTNTKFCYYNNYSLSQPRYFCKSCRRYWTKGGTLRNVPVGGGCRKSSSSSSSAAAKRPSSPSFSSSFKRAHNHDVMTPSPLLSSLHHYGHGGLGLGLASDAMIANPNSVAFLNSLNNAGSGLFQSLCYGLNEDNMGAHLPFEEAVTTTTMKQEGMAMGGNESKGTWGIPWQANYGEAAAGAGGGDHLEAMRGGWSTGLMSNSGGWHGLLNSTPLHL